MEAVADPREEGMARRDFLYITTGAFAAIGSAAALWPVADQWDPDATRFRRQASRWTLPD